MLNKAKTVLKLLNHATVRVGKYQNQSEADFKVLEYMKRHFTFSYNLLSRVNIYLRVPCFNALSKLFPYNMLSKGFIEIAFLKQSVSGG